MLPHKLLTVTTTFTEDNLVSLVKHIKNTKFILFCAVNKIGGPIHMNLLCSPFVSTSGWGLRIPRAKMKKQEEACTATLSQLSDKLSRMRRWLKGHTFSHIAKQKRGGRRFGASYPSPPSAETACADTPAAVPWHPSSNHAINDDDGNINSTK